MRAFQLDFHRQRHLNEGLSFTVYGSLSPECLIYIYNQFSKSDHSIIRSLRFGYIMFYNLIFCNDYNICI